MPLPGPYTETHATPPRRPRHVGGHLGSIDPQVPKFRHSGISTSGVVVGYSETTEGQQHAFVWVKGIMTDLGTLSGDSYSIAWGINPRGEIVGESGQHATLWTRK